MTHTTVELRDCQVDISPDGIRFRTQLPELVLSYEDFDEILEAVSRTEKFNPNPESP